MYLKPIPNSKLIRHPEKYILRIKKHGSFSYSYIGERTEEEKLKYKVELARLMLKEVINDSLGYVE